MPRAKAAALKALEIDGTLPEAHAVLGLVRTVFEYDWQGAESEFQKAIDLSPGLANAHHWYGFQLVAAGRFEEARAQLDRASSLDPLSAIIAVNAVWPDYYARRYGAAIERLRTILQAEPEFHSAHGLLGWAHEQLGQYSDAIAELKKGTLLFDNPEMTAYLAHAYAMSGQTEEAHRLLEELLALRQRRFVPSYDFGTIHLALGEKDRAVEWLRTAYQERSEALTWVQVDPKMDALRADPGYQAVVRLMGLSGNREMRSGPRFPERVPTAGRGSARDGRDTGGKRREAGKKLMPSRSGTSFTGLPCWGKTICSPGFPQCTGRI